MTLSPAFIETLKVIAKKKTWQDKDDENGEYFNPYDWCGGNFNDAYEGGVVTGEIEMARTVLEELGIDF
jgi:hypothetical protein